MFSRLFICILITIASTVRNNVSCVLLQTNQLLFSSVCQSGIREDFTNYIYCARKSLKSVPIFTKNNVVYDELVLADNQITELHASSFSRIKVKKVFLNGNPISYIDEMTFRKLENHLEELWIDGDTSISSTNLLAQPLYTAQGGLPKAIVAYLRNLKILHIKGFMVHTLTNGILKKLNRIEVLSLKFCSISKIEAFAFEGLDSSLKELYLDGNLMQQVPSLALLTTGFKSLQVLSLAQNRIKLITQDSFGSQLMLSNKFIKLDLSYNGLREINEKAFETLSESLETLELQNNEINSFNLGFLHNLRSLRELNLAYNVISNLPENAFFRSNRLEVLELQGNSIQFEEENRAHGGLRGLINLQRLNLARNSIAYLPFKLFEPASSLQSLTLDKNKIKNLNSASFEGLYSNLKNLSLQSCELSSTDLASLSRFRNLQRLKLNFNQINELDWDVFETAYSTLTNLEIRRNKIKMIRYSSCDEDRSASLNCKKQMLNLVEFDLSNNELCGFNTDLLARMPTLKNLGLSKNPLYCDCNILPLYEWSKVNFDKDTLKFIQWQCEVPSENNQHNTFRQFTSLVADDFKCFNNTSKCQQSKFQKKTVVPVTTTTAKLASTFANPIQLASTKITSMQLESFQNNILIVWSIDSDSLPNAQNANLSGFSISFKQMGYSDYKTFKVDEKQRNFKLQNLEFNVKYTVCVSAIQYQGYDKYCQDIITDAERAQIIESSTQIERLSTQPIALSTNNKDNFFLKNKTFLSSIIITILSVLIIFVVILLVFIYCYVKRCYYDKKQPVKSSIFNNNASNNNTMNARRQHGGYNYESKLTMLGPKMNGIQKVGCGNYQASSNSGSSSSPQSISTFSNQNGCPYSQVNSNNSQMTIGRQLITGDTSTVSSTLSNENMKQNKIYSRLNSNNNSNLLNQEVEYFNNELYNRELVKGIPSKSFDLLSTSPTKFQHLTLKNNQYVTYVPIDAYNQNILNQLQLNHNSNPMYYDKTSHMMALNNNTNTNNSDHEYCEIAANMGQHFGTANNRNNQHLANTMNKQFVVQSSFNNTFKNMPINTQSLLMTSANQQQLGFFDNGATQPNSKSPPSII